MKKIAFFLLTLGIVSLTSCGGESNGEKVDSTKTSSSEKSESTEDSKKAAPKTTIEFLETEFDFGTINEGDEAIHIFKVKNTGENPLIITDARPGCGCTVSSFTKEPIAPGEMGDIKVEFDSKGKNGPVTKSVTVITNTEPGSNVLSFKVNVLKKISGPFSEQK